MTESSKHSFNMFYTYLVEYEFKKKVKKYKDKYEKVIKNTGQGWLGFAQIAK